MGQLKGAFIFRENRPGQQDVEPLFLTQSHKDLENSGQNLNTPATDRPVKLV
jgi:hypothetical protein